jgi:exodeoxyribonuclease VII small subunit
VPDQKFNFEQALKELESITQWFESSDADLDQGLVKFERGMELASQLKTHLDGVENRVEKIKMRFNEPRATGQTATEQPAVEQQTEDSQAGLFGA